MSVLSIDQGPAGAAPSPWVIRWLSLLPSGASVLDFACGSGRHAREAARRGLRASAVDRDTAALAAVGPGVQVRAADLEAGPWPFRGERFDAVIVTRYLFRPRFALLAALVAPSGLLIYETFAQGNERFGRPSNPAFLLAPGELYERSTRAGLTVLAFEHGIVERAAPPGQHPAPAVVQRACAVRARGDGALRALG